MSKTQTSLGYRHKSAADWRKLIRDEHAISYWEKTSHISLKGDASLLNNPTVCIIGSRKATRDAKILAWRLARSHALYGWTVISGLCTGIDEWAHMGSLPKSIAVLPHGMNLLTKKRDATGILKRGGLAISPFPPTMGTRRWTYPIRNELMTLISDRLILVQAIASVGAIKTATAMALHKPTFIVNWPKSTQRTKIANSIPLSFQDLIGTRYVKTLKISLCRPPITIDEIAKRRGWSAKRAARAIGQWIINGDISPISNGLYAWND